VRARLLPLLTAVLLACGSQEDPSAPDRAPRPRGDATLGGEVLATVDGLPITRDEVVDAARAGDVSPAEALDRLVEMQLLALAAERAGAADDGREARRAAVLALLDRVVEAEEPPRAPTDDAIEAGADEVRRRLTRPPTRDGVTVSVAFQDENGRPLARAYVSELRESALASPDAAATLRALRRRPPDPSVPFTVEVREMASLTPTERRVPEELRQAIFAAAPGSLSVLELPDRIVVCLVETETPGAEPSDERVLERLAVEALAERRARRLVALLHDLGARTPVRVDRGLVRAALTAPQL
jgi:hypothetical protein